MFGDIDNDQRADYALNAIASYTAAKNEGAYEDEPLAARVGDLICDLLHLVRRDGEEEELVNGEPTSLLTRAQCNFEAEEEEESDEDDEDACPKCGEPRYSTEDGLVHEDSGEKGCANVS